MKAADGRIKKTTADIAAEKRRLDDANGGSHSIRIAEIEEKRADVVDARQKLGDHENGLDALKEDQRRAEKILEDSQGPLVAKREDVRQCERRLEALIKDRGQRQGAYHNSMPRLLNAIGQDDGFQQQPVGPIGNHVRLLKPMWSSVLEKSFGAALNSFVVTSKQDQSRLLDLMRRVGWYVPHLVRCQCLSASDRSSMCPIFIGNNISIDTSNHEPPPEFDTSLRVLEVSHRCNNIF